MLLFSLLPTSVDLQLFVNHLYTYEQVPGYLIHSFILLCDLLLYYFYIFVDTLLILMMLVNFAKNWLVKMMACNRLVIYKSLIFPLCLTNNATTVVILL